MESYIAESILGRCWRSREFPAKFWNWRRRHLGRTSEKNKIGINMSCIIGNTIRNKNRKGAGSYGDRWYGSGQAALTKTCPKCRQERGFANTFQLKGLSPFLQELDKFVNDETEHDGSLDATIPNWQNQENCQSINLYLMIILKERKTQCNAFAAIYI